MSSRNIFFLFVCFQTQVYASGLKCVELFSSAKTERTKHSTEEAEILVKLEALVKSSIHIQLNNFENSAQLQQAKEAFAKQLAEIIKINRKYLDVFKTMQAHKADELITTANEKSRKEREEKKEKDEKIKVALDPINFAKKLVFHEILPGTFNMLGAKEPVTITKAYELAQTQTTQLQWSMINVLRGKTDPALINPSHFKTGSDSKIIKIKGIDVQMKSDHPVEKVSYDDVMEWITGLNKLSKDGDAQVQKEIQGVIPGHQKGHIYDLPTEAQWAFMRQNRGKNNDMHFDKADESELDQYAWYDKNANDQTHEVASKKPRKIDRGDETIVEFYDLEGNVWEWNKDWYQVQLAGGYDPQGPSIKGFFRVVRGGSWRDHFDYLRADYRDKYDANLSSSGIGFRLSRTGP